MKQGVKENLHDFSPPRDQNTIGITTGLATNFFPLVKDFPLG